MNEMKPRARRAANIANVIRAGVRAMRFAAYCLSQAADRIDNRWGAWSDPNHARPAEPYCTLRLQRLEDAL